MTTERRPDSLNYTLVMEKFIEQKAGSPEKAASVLSISLSEVHAVLNKQEVSTKTRQSLMKVAATLQYDTPKPERHTRLMPEEVSAEKVEVNRDTSGEEVDTEPAMETREKPVTPDRQAAPGFRRSRRRNVSIREHESVDQSHEVSEQESNDSEGTSVEEKDASTVQVPSHSLSEDMDNSDSKVATVDSQVHAGLEEKEEPPTLSIERPTISVNREAIVPETEGVSENIVPEETHQLPEKTGAQQVDEISQETEASQGTEGDNSDDQDDLLNHLQEMERGNGQGEYLEGQETEEESKESPVSEIHLPDEVIHFENVIQELVDADNIVEHIRKMMFRRASWVRYEIERRDLEESEEVQEAKRRTSTQEMLDKREDRDPTLISLEGITGEEKFYHEHAYNAILEWRKLRHRRDNIMEDAEFDHNASDYLLCCDQVLAVEIYLIQEHDLTIPDNKDATRKVAWDGLERKEQIIWRLEDRKSILEEYDKARKREKGEATTRMLKTIVTSPARLFSRSGK